MPSSRFTTVGCASVGYRVASDWCRFLLANLPSSHGRRELFSNCMPQWQMTRLVSASLPRSHPYDLLTPVIWIPPVISTPAATVTETSVYVCQRTAPSCSASA